MDYLPGPPKNWQKTNFANEKKNVFTSGLTLGYWAQTNFAKKNWVTKFFCKKIIFSSGLSSATGPKN